MMPENSVGDYKKPVKRYGHPFKSEDQLEWTQACGRELKSELILFPKPFLGWPKSIKQLMSVSVCHRATLLTGLGYLWDMNLGCFWLPPWEYRLEKSDRFEDPSGLGVRRHSLMLFGEHFGSTSTVFQGRGTDWGAGEWSGRARLQPAAERQLLPSGPCPSQLRINTSAVHDACITSVIHVFLP